MLQVERDGGQPRYRMLATLRQFALEKLAASEEATAVRRRHRDYYVVWAEGTAKALHGPAAREASDMLDRELDNLMAAHAFCGQDPEGGSLGMRLAHALELYWLDRGLLARGSQVAREALGIGGGCAIAGARGTVARCGPACLALRRYRAGKHVARRVRDAGPDPPRRDLRCRALALAGDVAQRNGDLAGARRELDDASRRSTRAG